jgi:hypothetical protein
MMKDLLKKKMQHVINLHVHVGKNLQEDDESKKTSDMAPMVEDKGDYNSKPSHPMEEMVQSHAQPVMSPSDHEDDDRISVLENIGADASHKNPKSLRGKAMYAAGQEMNRLKAKKKKS